MQVDFLPTLKRYQGPLVYLSREARPRFQGCITLIGALAVVISNQMRQL